MKDMKAGSPKDGFCLACFFQWRPHKIAKAPEKFRFQGTGAEPILSHAAMRYLGLKAGWQGPLLVFGVLFVDVVLFCSKKLYDIGGNI